MPDNIVDMLSTDIYCYSLKVLAWLTIDDDRKHIFVADFLNNRVLMLDTDLKCLGTIHAPHDLEQPNRLHFDSETERLLIGENSGRLVVVGHSD